MAASDPGIGEDAEKRGPIPDTHTTAIFAVLLRNVEVRPTPLPFTRGTPDARRRAHALFRT